MSNRRGVGISVKMILSTTFLLLVVVLAFGYLNAKNLSAVYDRNAQVVTDLRKEAARDIGKAQIGLLAQIASTPLSVNDFTTLRAEPPNIKEKFPEIDEIYIGDAQTNQYLANAEESLNGKDILCPVSGAVPGCDLNWPTFRDAHDPLVLEDVVVGGARYDVFSHPVVSSDEKVLGVSVLTYSLAGLEAQLRTLQLEKRRQSENALVTTALIGGLCVLVGSLLAIFQGLSISKPLKMLALRADQIARGDLETRVEIRSRDEIGLLGENFNYMADRLLVLMQDTAKKATLEKELEVARTIQETLVPSNDTVDRKVLRLAGYFQPASECGGDWWSYHDLVDGKLLVIIGDVTGHGVPSAMITAAAKAACDAVRAMTNDNMTVTYLLEILNRAIYEAAKRKFVMTCFASIIDTHTLKITYANAGHNFPYLYRQQNGKGEFGCLMTRGNRLGDLQESKYASKEMDLQAGDVLVWYTDGIVECENPQGEEFGEKRFRAAIRRAANEEPANMREQVVASAASFFADRPRKDDITMVIARVY